MRLVLALLAICSCLPAEVITFTREDMIRNTPKNPFERFPDGRPKVPDALLEKLRAISQEEVWPILNQAGFTHQYEGKWTLLHPGRKLVGRAVTAQYLPLRPDVYDATEAEAQQKKLAARGHRRMVDVLQNGDVLVVDLFGNLEAGGPIGDNLATAIHAATKTGGLVIDGAVRDLEGILEIPMAAYFRQPHPAPVNNVMLSGINIPIRIGGAVVMPGDIVLGDREGIFFIPPQFVPEIVRTAEITHIHDEWTKAKMLTGKYKPSDLYPTPTDPALLKEYEAYLKQKLGR